MCVLYAYDKYNDKSAYATDFGSGIPRQEASTTNPPVSICVSTNFIYTWINKLENNFAWSCCSYQEKMREILEKSY